MKKTENVFVAILAGSNHVNTSLADLGNQLPYLSSDDGNPYRFAYWIESGCRGQELARNRIVERFLETKCDTLLMIDDDMIVYSQTTLGVLQTPDYDIAAPVQFMFDPQIDEEKRTVDPKCRSCAFKYDEVAGGYREFLPPPGVTIQDVDAVGSGCIAIKRRVFEHPSMPLAPDMSPPAFFRLQLEANGTRRRGNDIDFCHRARNLGFRIKMNWGARIGHFKTVDLYQIELYAKNHFKLGYETGFKHGMETLQLEKVKGRADRGRDRVT